MKHATPGKIFFEHANIKVTESRFSTGAEIFPIKKIMAVNVAADKPILRTGLPLAAGGIAALIGGMLANIPLLIVAGAACSVGGAMMCFAKVNRTLVLTIRGKDINALTSKNAALINSVASAIGDALAQRR